MSLGLVTADADGIYLAAESEGLRCGLITSKIRLLQSDPEFAIVVTGGLEHWRYVFTSFRWQPNLRATCDEIARLLNENMNRTNQAYGLLCGYEGDQPVWYRITRSVGSEVSRWYKGRLTAVEMIGIEEHAVAARQNAEAAILRGNRPEQALREAIESRIPGEGVRGPVESMRIPCA